MLINSCWSEVEGSHAIIEFLENDNENTNNRLYGIQLKQSIEEKFSIKYLYQHKWKQMDPAPHSKS